MEVHDLKQRFPSFRMHIYATKPQWVNTSSLRCFRHSNTNICIPIIFGDICRQFRYFFSAHYGNCYTFNSVLQRDSPLQATATGPSNGKYFCIWSMVFSTNTLTHIEVATRWPSFCRWHYQMCFLDETVGILIHILLRCVPLGWVIFNLIKMRLFQEQTFRGCFTN